MNKIMLALVLLGLAGSNSRESVIVHAQSPQPAIPNCFRERFYDGPTETPDYLQFASQACLITADVSETYTLKYDHVVQAVWTCKWDPMADLDSSGLSGWTSERRQVARSHCLCSMTSMWIM
jgi:hypothetical protein